MNILMRLEDRLVDVVRENYDLAIRTGKLGNTDGVAPKIAALETVLFATPAYLDAVGRPHRPEDLIRLKFIQLHEDQTRGFFPLIYRGQEIEPPIRVGFTANNPQLIMQAVNDGSGYTRAPRFFVAQQLRVGTYEQVLPSHGAPDKAVFAIFPSRHSIDQRRDLVIEVVVVRLSQMHRRPPAPDPATITA